MTPSFSHLFKCFLLFINTIPFKNWSLRYTVTQFEYKNQETKQYVKYSPFFNHIVLVESQWSHELGCPGVRGHTGSRWGNRCAHQKNCSDAVYSKGFLSEARCAGRACWRWPRGLRATWAGWLQIRGWGLGVRVGVRSIRLELDLGSLILG